MPYYLINTNAQSNGDNEVHVTPKQHSSCSYPAPQNQKHFGSFEPSGPSSASTRT